MQKSVIIGYCLTFSSKCVNGVNRLKINGLVFIRIGKVKQLTKAHLGTYIFAVIEARLRALEKEIRMLKTESWCAGFLVNLELTILITIFR